MVTYGKEYSGSLGFAGLGTLSLGVEGGVFGTGKTDPDLVPLNFSVRRGQEGPQTVISWDPPSSVTDETYTTTYEVRLERRTLDFSHRKGDATVVYSGTLTGSHAVSEITTALASQYSHYYTLYVKTPTAGQGYTGDDAELFVTAPSLKRSVIVLDSGYFTDKMYSLLPGFIQASDLFPQKDNESNPTAVLVSSIGTGDLLSEKFNFSVSQTTKYGPLFRFLKIAGVHLDEIRGLIDYIPKLYDVDECDYNYLPFLAGNLALQLNAGLTVTAQRADTRNITHYYKWKGTEEAFESRGKALATAKTVYVKEYNEDTFLTNYSDRLTGNAAIKRGKNYTANTIIPEKARPDLRAVTTGGAYLFGHTGDSDLLANVTTVDGLGNQISFAEVTNFNIANLLPYEKLDMPGNYTVEGRIKVKRWPKPSATLGTVTKVNVFSRQVTDGAQDIMTFQVTLNTIPLATSGMVVHRLAFYVGNETSNFGGTWIPLQLKEELGQIELNVPVSFALTRSYEIDSDDVETTTYEVFVNGVSIGTDTSNDYARPAYSDLSAGTGFKIGDAGSGAMRDAAFVVDDLRVWDIVRSPADILADHKTPVSSYKNGLVFNTSLDLKENDDDARQERWYDTATYNSVGTSTVEGSDPYGTSPDVVAGLVTEPHEANDWPLSKQQKFFIQDKEWYTSGDPVGIKGVKVFIFSQKKIEDSLAVSL